MIPERYPVIELTDGRYAKRTAQNVADSDGTLIISKGEPIGGTRETVERCVEMQKPYLVIDSERVQAKEAIELAFAFVRSLSSRAEARDPDEVALKPPRRDPSTSLGMTVLNVAGPRASQWPDGHAFAYQIMSAILRRISGQTDAN